MTGITFGGTGTCTAAPTATIAAPGANTEQWVAYTTQYYIYLAKLPITANTVD